MLQKYDVKLFMIALTNEEGILIKSHASRQLK